MEHNLDYFNHELVIELADQFNSHDLKKKALRFQTENSSRNVQYLSRRGHHSGKVLELLNIKRGSFEEKGTDWNHNSVRLKLNWKKDSIETMNSHYR